MALKAKPAMVMTAFNAIDRKPISGNKELLKGLLRDKEGFEGTVISDWGSIGQLEEQGVAADMEEAAIQASEAGVDIDMMSPASVSYTHLDVYKRQAFLSPLDG